MIDNVAVIRDEKTDAVQSASQVSVKSEYTKIILEADNKLNDVGPAVMLIEPNIHDPQANMGHVSCRC